jgi:hypothetical protein
MTGLRLSHISVITLGILIPLLATTLTKAALIDDVDATGRWSSSPLRRAPAVGNNTTVAWGWWTRRCRSHQMPNCPYGAAYVSGHDSCGPIWSCGQSYIPNNSRPDTWNAPSPPPGWFDR